MHGARDRWLPRPGFGALPVRLIAAACCLLLAAGCASTAGGHDGTGAGTAWTVAPTTSPGDGVEAVTITGAPDGIALGSLRNELAAVVYRPADLPATRLPVALVQHGGHNQCTSPEDNWPCSTPEARTPSYLGYGWLAAALVRQGYAVVSVSANATIGRADVSAGPALFAWWLRTLAQPAGSLPDLADHVDLTNVVLVGHSRGGDLVAQILTGALTGGDGIDLRQVRAAVLLAPVFPVDDPKGRSLGTSTVPTLTLYGTCDGDAGGMPATWARSFTSRHSRTRVLTGANHNFFNFEWTPGTGVPDARDDAADLGGACASGSRGRLTAAGQQREAAAAIVRFLASVP